MRIDRIHIDDFGKLHDFSFDFNKGLNIICEDNEFGKTTIMSFILLMFYGRQPNDSSSDISKSLRKKYRPWNMQPMAGSIWFEASGVNYSLYKQFGTTPRTDIIQLVNIDDNEELHFSEGEEIGKKFFGLDSSDFEKSVFIRMTGAINGSSTNSDMAVKLSNLISSGDEETSGSVVLKRIISAEELLVSKRGYGKINDLEERIALLNKQINEGTEAGEKSAELEYKISAIKSEIEKLSEEKLQNEDKTEILHSTSDLENLERIKIQMSLVKDKQIDDIKIEVLKNAEKVKKNISLTEQGINNLNAQLDDEIIIIDEDEYSEFQKNVKTRDECKNISEFIVNAVKPAVNNVKKASERYEEEEKNKIVSKKMDYILFIVGGLCAVIAILAAVFHILPMMYCFITGALFCIVSGIIKIKQTRKKNKLAVDNHENKLIELKKEMDDGNHQLKEQLCVLSEKIHNFQDEDIDTIEADNNKKMLEAENEIRLFLKDTGYEEKEVFNAYQESVRAIKTKGLIKNFERDIDKMKQEFSAIMGNIARCDSYNDAETLYFNMEKNLNEYRMEKASLMKTLDSLKIDEKMIDERIEKYKKALSDLGLEEQNSELQIKKITERNKKIDVIIQEKNEILIQIANQNNVNSTDIDSLVEHKKLLVNERDDMKKYYEALGIAKKYLNMAINEAGKSFGPVLNKTTAKIFSKLTNREFDALMVDREYKISIREKNGPFHEWKYLSNGTIDQAYLALRLAMTEIITEKGEKLPLMLDDVFIQYDSNRKMYAINYLKKQAEETQIIYFCHS